MFLFGMHGSTDVSGLNDDEKDFVEDVFCKRVDFTNLGHE